MFVALFLIIIGGYPGCPALTYCTGVRSRFCWIEVCTINWNPGAASSPAVLFQAVIEISNQEPAAYLRLSNLCSLTGVYSIVSETRLVIGGNWIREVRSLAGRRPNRLPCWANESVPSGILFFISRTTSGWVESGLMLSTFIIGIFMVW